MTTTLVSDLPISSQHTDDLPILNGLSELEETSNDSSPLSPLFESLECAVCNQTFEARDELNTHILEHVKQPKIVLKRVDIPQPEKTEKHFAAWKNISHQNLISQVIEQERPPGSVEEYPLVPKIRILLPQQLSDQVDAREKKKLDSESEDEPKELEDLQDSNTENNKMVELQTLPSESQSPSFPGQSPGQPDVLMHQSNDSGSFWGNDDTPVTNQSPLRNQESGEKEAERHDSLLQNFLNDSADNVVSSKDPGMIIPSHETEFISLDRLAGPQCSVCGERYVDQAAFEMHCKATGHYPSNSLVPYGQTALATQHPQLSNSLDSLTNLPMQQLAQQVNRLQQQGQVHQQNVLINIQQFGQPMAPPNYGGGEMPPHMHHMPHYQPQQNQHMYMPQVPHAPYHPGPPHHMYYPGGGPSGGMFPPHPSQQQHHQPNPQPPPQPQPRPQYHHREPNAMMPPRMPPPRVPPPHSRPPMQMRGPQPTRGGMVRGRGAVGPRGMQGPQPTGRGAPNQQQRIILQKRTAAQEQQQIKKKRMDMLIPDTNDDADCHVISMQKCNDGLPIIKNVQGAATTTADGLDPVVHLTDSITLSVRNPKEAAPVTQQKKNDAKAVANILATRGITVTPATKSQKEMAATVTKPTPAPVAINLNSAVSIIPTARNQQAAKPGTNGAPARPPTVDLTEDEPPKNNAQGGKRALPHQCDLCPAQYPNMRTLVIHRRQYHKAGPQSELGVPIVDLSQPTVLSKLASLGIHSYIPLPQTGSGANATFALPIVSVNAARNPNVCNISALGSGAVLTLGPLHHISNLPNKQ